MLHLSKPTAAALLLVGVLATSGCSGSSDAAGSCPAGKLPTAAAGTLTLETGAVTAAPWVVGGAVAGRSNDPRGGKGYDAAVGYALAERLGYDRAHVRWIGMDFSASLEPGAKPFDVGVNQTTITTERRKKVDLSDPYWVTREAVVTIEGRPLESVTTLAGLKDIPLATVTSDRIAPHPGVTEVAFDTYDDLRRAVVGGDPPGLVTSYSAGLRIQQSGREIVGAKLVGLLPPQKGAETYGMVLPKGSALTSCVNEALAALRKDGTLEALEERWLIQELGLRDLR